MAGCQQSAAPDSAAETSGDFTPTSMGSRVFQALGVQRCMKGASLLAAHRLDTLSTCVLSPFYSPSLFRRDGKAVGLVQQQASWFHGMSGELGRGKEKDGASAFGLKAARAPSPNPHLSNLLQTCEQPASPVSPSDIRRPFFLGAGLSGYKGPCDGGGGTPAFCVCARV